MYIYLKRLKLFPILIILSKSLIIIIIIFQYLQDNSIINKSIRHSRIMVHGVETIFIGVPRLPVGFRVALPRHSRTHACQVRVHGQRTPWWPLIHSPSKARNQRASSVKAKWGEGLRGWMCRRGL